MADSGEGFKECLEDVLQNKIEERAEESDNWQCMLYIFKCVLLIAKDINHVSIHVYLTL